MNAYIINVARAEIGTESTNEHPFNGLKNEVILRDAILIYFKR